MNIIELIIRSRSKLAMANGTKRMKQKLKKKHKQTRKTTDAKYIINKIK